MTPIVVEGSSGEVRVRLVRVDVCWTAPDSARGRSISASARSFAWGYAHAVKAALRRSIAVVRNFWRVMMS